VTGNRRFPTAFAALTTLALAVALAACGSSSDSTSSTTAATSTTPSSASAFTVKSVPGTGQILVDAKGNALYTNDQDTATSVKCTAECAAVWVPLTQGGKPVISNGKPLYTFTADSSGKVTGDGVTDSFGGVSFTWSVASPSGGAAKATPAPSSSGTSTSSGSSSSSGGGYGY
jgi:predicted lipoprotein with Yx(FWY)xxD motif